MTASSNALLLDMYRAMLTARRFDEAQLKAYKAGKLKVEPVHSYIGQEAISVGAGFALKDGDYLSPSLRSRPAFFALGVPIEMQWAGVLSRAACPGMGVISSRHMTALDYRILGTTGIVGSHIPTATGAAMALQRRNPGHAVICIFGDGAANRGDFHEGLNMAALYKAPIVFLCEANGVAESQEWASYMPIEDLSVRAKAYSMPGAQIDGNDVELVHEQCSRAIELARKGEGPSLIVAETCRMRAHVEGLPDFRSAAFLEQWRLRDPVKCAEKRILADGLLSADDVANLTAKIDGDIDHAFELALAQPVLEPHKLGDLLFHGSGSA